MPGTVFVRRKEHAIQHIVAGCAGKSPELCHEQLVESGLQHALERNEGFAPVPCNQERFDDFAERLPDRVILPGLLRRTPELGMSYLQLTHPVCEPLNAPHFVRSLEGGGDGYTCGRGHVPDVSCDHLQAVTWISKGGEYTVEQGQPLRRKTPVVVVADRVQEPIHKGFAGALHRRVGCVCRLPRIAPRFPIAAAEFRSPLVPLVPLADRYLHLEAAGGPVMQPGRSDVVVSRLATKITQMPVRPLLGHLLAAASFRAGGCSADGTGLKRTDHLVVAVAHSVFKGWHRIGNHFGMAAPCRAGSCSADGAGLECPDRLVVVEAHSALEGWHHDFQFGPKVEWLPENIFNSAPRHQASAWREHADIRAAVEDFDGRVQPPNRFEHGLGAVMAGQDRSHAITDILSVWEVRAWRMDIHENLAILNLDRETSEADRRGVDPAAAADVILPVVGAAGKYVSVQPPLAQGHAEMCAPILVGVNNAVVPDKKKVATIDAVRGHVTIPKFSIRDYGLEGLHLSSGTTSTRSSGARPAFDTVSCGSSR